MADIALTAARVEPTHVDKVEIYSMIAGATITKGQALYMNTSGKCDLADASAASTGQFIGIAMNGAASGDMVEVLVRGMVYGFTLTDQDYGEVIFLSNTAGAFADAAGTVTVRIGRVLALSDSTPTKVLYIAADLQSNWS